MITHLVTTIYNITSIFTAICSKWTGWSLLAARSGAYIRVTYFSDTPIPWFNHFLIWTLIYCMFEKCVILLSRYASTRPIQKQFFSSFIFLQFSRGTVEIWNISKNERIDAYLQNLHTFVIIWRMSQVFIRQKVLVIWPFRFLSLNIFFNFIWQVGKSFFWLFGRKWVVKNESVIFLSQNGKYEIL